MGRRKLITDADLLAKARTVFVRNGIGVSSREIARQIGVSNSVLFQRFGSMEELLFAAMTPPAPDLQVFGGRAKSNPSAGIEPIVFALLAYFRTLVPILLPLATHPSFEYEAFRKRHPTSPLEQLRTELTSVLEEKRRRAEIACSDVGMVVLHLMTVAYGLAMFEQIGVHDGEFSRKHVRELAKQLLNGISPRRARPASSRGSRRRNARA